MDKYRNLKEGWEYTRSMESTIIMGGYEKGGNYKKDGNIQE